MVTEHLQKKAPVHALLGVLGGHDVGCLMSRRS